MAFGWTLFVGQKTLIYVSLAMGTPIGRGEYEGWFESNKEKMDKNDEWKDKVCFKKEIHWEWIIFRSSLLVSTFLIHLLVICYCFFLALQHSCYPHPSKNLVMDNLKIVCLSIMFLKRQISTATISLFIKWLSIKWLIIKFAKRCKHKR